MDLWFETVSPYFNVYCDFPVILNWSYNLNDKHDFIYVCLALYSVFVFNATQIREQISSLAWIWIKFQNLYFIYLMLYVGIRQAILFNLFLFWNDVVLRFNVVWIAVVFKLLLFSCCYVVIFMLCHSFVQFVVVLWWCCLPFYVIYNFTFCSCLMSLIPFHVVSF